MSSIMSIDQPRIARLALLLTQIAARQKNFALEIAAIRQMRQELATTQALRRQICLQARPTPPVDVAVAIGGFLHVPSQALN